MKFLIIGGTGLISTSITRILLERGEDVTLFNRGKTPARFEKGAKVILGNRRDFSAFESQVLEAGPFDVVIDMICYQPEEAKRSVHIFQGKIHQYIFCSTVDVYNRPANRLPYQEDEPRIGLSDYAKNKILCEDIFFAAHLGGDFKTTIIRPAATYGEGGMIIHSFGWNTTYLDRLLKGKPIVVHGDGNSLWVMCHIDDVARAHIAAAGNPKAYGKAYHATGEEWMTWNQYHHTVSQAIGAPPPSIVHIPTDLLYQLSPERAGIDYFNFQYSNIFDNSAAKADLSFAYTIPFLEGAARTFAWLKDNHRIQSSDEDPFDDQVIAAWTKLSQEMTQSIKN